MGFFDSVGGFLGEVGAFAGQVGEIAGTFEDLSNFGGGDQPNVIFGGFPTFPPSSGSPSSSPGNQGELGPGDDGDAPAPKSAVNGVLIIIVGGLAVFLLTKGR